MDVVHEVLEFWAATPTWHLEFDARKLAGPVRIAAHADANLLAERARQGLAISVGDSVAMGVTLCKTQRQSTISTSTAEAEVKGLSWAGRVLLGFANVLREILGLACVPVSDETILEGDNAAANLLARREADLRKVRHVSLADLWIREATADRRLAVRDVETAKNRSDFMTKVLSGSKLLSACELANVTALLSRVLIARVARLVEAMTKQAAPQWHSVVRSLKGNPEDFASLVMAVGIAERTQVVTKGDVTKVEFDSAVIVYYAKQDKLKVTASSEAQVEEFLKVLDPYLEPYQAQSQPQTKRLNDVSEEPAKRAKTGSVATGANAVPVAQWTQPPPPPPRECERPSQDQYRRWMSAIVRRYARENLQGLEELLLRNHGQEARLMDEIMDHHYGPAENFQ